MADNDKEPRWKISSQLAVGVICVLLTGAISFNAWAVSSISERPTRAEVAEMIEDKSPYARDKSLILQSLQDIRLSNIELRRAMKEQTDTIAQLKATVETWKTRTSIDR